MGRDRTSKIVINNTFIEQVNTFNYLQNLVANEKEKDINNKIIKILNVTGIINNTLK
jgi:hypothetical protein